MPDTTTLIITRCEEKSGEVLVYGRETSDPDTAERLLFTKKGRLRAFSQTQVAVEFYDGATEYYNARGAMVMPDFTANGAADTRWIKYAMIAVVILIIVATAMGVPIG